MRKRTGSGRRKEVAYGQTDPREDRKNPDRWQVRERMRRRRVEHDQVRRRTRLRARAAPEGTCRWTWERRQSPPREVRSIQHDGDARILSPGNNARPRRDLKAGNGIPAVGAVYDRAIRSIH